MEVRHITHKQQHDWEGSFKEHMETQNVGEIQGIRQACLEKRELKREVTLF